MNALFLKRAALAVAADIYRFFRDIAGLSTSATGVGKPEQFVVGTFVGVLVWQVFHVLTQADILAPFACLALFVIARFYNTKTSIFT